jgi:hypothetical protein
MSEDGLLAIRRREFIATTDSGHGMPIYPNLAASLELSAVDQCWHRSDRGNAHPIDFKTALRLPHASDFGVKAPLKKPISLA